MHDCLAVCPPGLEPILAGELRELGLRPTGPLHGGVPLRATDRELYLANVWTRVATRVVVRLGTFVARSFADLEARAASIPWDTYLAPGIAPVFRVTAAKSRLYHTDAIAERLHRVVGVAPPADDVATDPTRVQLFVVRAVHDRFTISADASGDSLHRRGWRQEVAKAPLRETIAAAMVRACGHDAGRPFVDPMCGSGTVAIEAALAAAGLAPGADRTFAFQRWPSFKPGTWASVAAGVRAAADDATRRARVGPILAADRDEGAVRAATANAERAGVADLVRVHHGALRTTLQALRGAPPGTICANPPYGVRVGGAAAGGSSDLRDLYGALGATVRGELPAWRVALLVADRNLAAHCGLAFEERFATTNGGIDVAFLVAEGGAVRA